MHLRPYQVELINNARRALRVHRRVLIQLPTGGGKTVIAATMMHGSVAKGLRCWFVVHRRELVEQTARTLETVGVPHGFCAAGFPVQYKKPVTLCGVQTLVNRLDKLPPPDLIIWDEAHHCAAGTWKRVRDAYPDAYHVGLTATPERLDGKGLSDAFAALVPGPSTAWLIDNGFLTKPRIWTQPAPDLEGMKMRGADYDPSALATVMDAPHLLGDAVDHYQRICPHAQAVVFCVSVAHALHTRDAFRAAGVSAEELDGQAKPHHRKSIVAKFRRGEIKVLTSVDLFGEGFDLPELECAILLRPTASLGLYMQQVGRALRAAPGKQCAYILDHAGNVARHGPPDAERDWSLDGRKRKRGKAEAPTKICPSCFGAVHAASTSCLHCGHVFAATPREIDKRHGDLVEIDTAILRARRRQEVAKAKDREALEAIARERGYKPGWVDYVLNARRGRDHAGAA
ncbi:MAG: DEAD/DEAH box helicase [Betaproteobacteria bacterium]|nr:DEAD/DEAH box helicase [Betaproteobacteria bacterium]